MATYKLTGRRYLRKYTAACETPVYAAAMDAQAVVDGFCDVPWEESKVGQGTFALHTSEQEESSGLDGYDRNVRDRETLDAALFCAGHKGGVHRAYANAACYVFELPDMATYPNLVSLTAKVRCDPYASTGARIALHVSDTDTIPTNCNVVRLGDLHAEGVAPRTVSTVDGADYWYSTAADCVLAPAENETLALKKYLFVYVGLESYSTVRGNWLEGSAFIEPTVELETSDDLTGWTDGGSEDATPETEFVVCDSLGGEGCASTETSVKMTSINTRAVYSAADHGFSGRTMAGGAKVSSSGGVFDPEEESPGNVAGLGVSGEPVALILSAYAEVLSGRSVANGDMDITPDADYDSKRFAGWMNYAQNGSTSGTNDKGVRGWCGVSWRIVLLPFVLPRGFKPRKIRFDWNSVAANNIGPMIYSAWMLPGVALRDYSSAFGGGGGDGASLAQGGLWTAESDKVGSWLRLASFDAPDTTAASESTVSADYYHEQDLSFDMTSRIGTILLTAYADPSGIPTSGASGRSAYLYRAVSGSDAQTLKNLLLTSVANNNGQYRPIDAAESPFCHDGWKPKITFIG